MEKIKVWYIVESWDQSIYDFIIYYLCIKERFYCKIIRRSRLNKKRRNPKRMFETSKKKLWRVIKNLYELDTFQYFYTKNFDMRLLGDEEDKSLVES